jgi:hypothetical protein
MLRPICYLACSQSEFANASQIHLLSGEPQIMRHLHGKPTFWRTANCFARRALPGRLLYCLTQTVDASPCAGTI